MAMNTLTNRMIQMAKRNAGRTVTDQGTMRRGHRFPASLSYRGCLAGLPGHERSERGRDVTGSDAVVAVRAGRLGGPGVSSGWVGLGRPQASRFEALKPTARWAA